ncbi:glycoside hydrolase family 3 N-terminal domain-containing protein [Konateibacter massiliensis]|uniref:glycoside hydrolase family 3 N-terminal domain-containing protein n=1 Tax=Konateibacter massiliensis TaxID=2002841 RepID=UPI000C15C3A6|nr:glycoside hydrolase family 3 N-terminal domain-containing protein [Konateibacter massiliensis]
MKKEKKQKLRMNGRKYRCITIPLMVLVLLVNVLIGAGTNMMKSTLNTYLGAGETITVNPDGTEEWDTDYYEQLYANSTDSTAAAYEVAASVMEEGSVLLKNNGILPLEKGSTITPFGRGYLDPIYGQLTSGGSAKWVVDPITPEEALATEYNINNAAVELMNAAKDPEPLMEAEGTSAAGVAGSMLGGNSYIYEYAPSVYEGLDDVSGTTGIVMISRTGQEGSDKKYDAYEDGTPHYLALTENEKAAIRTAKESCGSVIVVLVSSAVLELSELMSGDLEADAILWLGHPGEQGFGVLAGLLDGDINPSGRTVDIYPSDLTADPSYQNIGSFEYDNVTLNSSSLTDGGEIPGYYTEYQEDMYIGYRYYETADFMDENFIYGELDGNGAFSSEGAVCYPFGYGLSYTTFSQEIVSYEDSDENIVVGVQVTNTGDTYTGKCVVQLYYNAPYTQFDIDNQIEKPVANLIAFDKTDELAPGETQTMTLSFTKEDMASYCYTHDNGNGTLGCYVLEEGDYEISLRNNSHDVIDTKITNLPETFWYDGSDEAHIRQTDKDAQSELDEEGNPVEVTGEGSYVAATNEFQTSSNYMNSETQILTRANWTGTFPQTIANRTKTLGEDYVALVGDYLNFDIETDKAFGNVEGSAVYAEEQPVSGQENGLTLSSMRGRDYADPLWEDYLDQIDWNADKDQIILNFAGAAYTLGQIESLGIKSTIQEDGANGLKVQGSDNGYDMSKSSSFPFAPVIAATWNTELLYQVGAAFGQEALTNGITGWYCPAINLHRSQFSGRVFEYYSEDPILSGKLAAACVSGAGDQGMVCYIKHFALNDTETNRSALCSTWATEQAMRELYLKTFEVAIKEARMTIKYTADEDGNTATKVIRAATGVMPAQNGVGETLGTVNANLIQNVLRGEWGFEGMLISDYWVWGDNSLRDLAVRTGCDTYLCMYMPMLWSLNDYDSATARTAMRTAIHNVSYALANSNATQNAAPGTTYYTTMATWQKLVIALQVVIYLLTALYVWRLIRRIKDEKNYPEKYKPRKRNHKEIIGLEE